LAILLAMPVDVTRKFRPTGGGLKPIASAGARSYNGGLGRSRGQVAKPPEADSFFVDRQISPVLVFGRKLQKLIFRMLVSG